MIKLILVLGLPFSNLSIPQNIEHSVSQLTMRSHGAEIEKMLEMGMQDLPQECACLLEVDPADLYHWDMSQLTTTTILAASHDSSTGCQYSTGSTRGRQAGVIPDGSTHTPYGEMEVGAGELRETQASYWRRNAGEVSSGKIGQFNH